MAWVKWALAAIAALAIPAAAQSPTQLQPTRTIAAVTPARAPAIAGSAAAHDLSKSDVDAWLELSEVGESGSIAPDGVVVTPIYVMRLIEARGGVP